MTPQAATLMAEYNRWMNQRMYAAASQLPESELTKDRGAFFGSILQTLNHIAAGDTIWLHRFSQHPQASVLSAEMPRFAKPTSLRYQVAASLAELRAYRETLDDIILRWSQSLTPTQLAATFDYQSLAGQPSSKIFGGVVLHFFNHQTHHRGQVSTLLFQAGVDVGVTDLLTLVPNQT